MAQPTPPTSTNPSPKPSPSIPSTDPTCKPTSTLTSKPSSNPSPKSQTPSTTSSNPNPPSKPSPKVNLASNPSPKTSSDLSTRLAATPTQEKPATDMPKPLANGALKIPANGALKPAANGTPKPPVGGARKPQVNGTSKPSANGPPKPVVNVTPKSASNVTTNLPGYVSPRPIANVTPRPPTNLAPKPPVNLAPKPKLPVKQMPTPPFNSTPTLVSSLSSIPSPTSSHLAVKPLSKTLPKPPARLPLNPTSKTTSKTTVKPSSKTTAKPHTNVPTKPPAKALTKTSTKPSTKVPVNASMKEPANPQTNILAKPPTKVPIKPPTKILAKPLTKVPAKPSAKVSAKPPTKAPVQPSAKVTAKTTSKLQGKPVTKLAAKSTARLPARPLTKQPPKLPSKSTSKAPSRTPPKTQSKASAKTPSKSPTRSPTRPSSKSTSKTPSKIPINLPPKPSSQAVRTTTPQLSKGAGRSQPPTKQPPPRNLTKLPGQVAQSGNARAIVAHPTAPSNGVPSANSQQPTTDTSRRHRPRAPSPPRRPSEVSREVFLLTAGQTPPSLVPSVPIAALASAKPTHKRSWRRVPFRNSARADGLQLTHWALAGGGEADSTFARFNRKIKMVEYTDKEYEEVVASLMPLILVKRGNEGGEKDGEKDAKVVVNFVKPQEAWTRDETDTVFRMCKELDFRFVIIHDRWPEHLKPRTVDEIKDRYYSVAKVVMEKRHSLMADTTDKFAHLSLAMQKHCQSIIMNPFDYEYECIRKNQLEVQYRRSKDELREEEETVREARRIEANRKRLVKERTRLAKLLTPAGDIMDPSRAAAAAAFPQKTFPHRKITSGASARSSMIYTPVTQSGRLARRIDEALVELGVGTRPTPTSIVVDNFDLLRMEILQYIELHKTVMRKEEDVHLLRIKLAKMKGLPAPAPPPGINSSHKKRKADDLEIGSLFGGGLSAPPTKVPKIR